MVETESFSIAVISYWIGRPFTRRGYGTRMVELALEHAFDVIEVERVEADVQPGNDASRHLLRGVGFRMVGYSPRLLEIGGKQRVHERWTMLRNDWRRRDTERSRDIRTGRGRAPSGTARFGVERPRGR